jgi:hypothetical protein
MSDLSSTPKLRQAMTDSKQIDPTPAQPRVEPALVLIMVLVLAMIPIDLTLRQVDHGKAVQLRIERQRVLDERLLAIEHDLKSICKSRGIACD